ncbi:hypothetical protein [Candidatus Colwellia aromaticivorans]|uniref:hypothetical protein n=1 Tax=Candidatus Colwellia aromaticivorans TaxID=2267621 RepID=UPI000DF284EF|nr:hypothetical protein [Candidatus Colwellia aromaticivorans]
MLIKLFLCLVEILFYLSGLSLVSITLNLRKRCDHSQTHLANKSIYFICKFANDSQVDKVIAKTTEQISPLLNGQQIPSAIRVTTIGGEK